MGISRSKTILFALVVLSMQYSAGVAKILMNSFESAHHEDTVPVSHPEASVHVPKGWKVLSGGAFVISSGGGQFLTKCYPVLKNGVPTGWSVASKDHIQGDPGTIQAFANAIYDPEDEWEVIVKSASSNVAPHPAAVAYLPHGYTLVGGGANVHWTGVGNMLVASRPYGSNGWQATSKDHIHSDPARIEAFVIGIRSKKGEILRTRIRSESSSPKGNPIVYVWARSPYVSIGGGGSVSTGGVGNMLTNLIPGQKGRWFYASSKEHIHEDPQVVTAYSIESLDAEYE